MLNGSSGYNGGGSLLAEPDRTEPWICRAVAGLTGRY